MLNNILIHIGLHKTATTWLQNELFCSDNNIFEPLSLTNKGHSTLASSFYLDKQNYMLSPFEYNLKCINKNIDQIFDIKGHKFKNKIPVLSHERLSGNPHSGGFDSKIIADRLKKTFPKARILIMIREQNSFLLSNYFQYIYVGGNKSYKKYLNSKYDDRVPFFSPNYLNYYLIVKYYYKLFGEQNVLVLPYEIFSKEPYMFFNYLSKFVNKDIKINTEIINKTWNKRTYYFSWYSLKFLNAFRKKSSVNSCFIYSNKYLSYFIDIFISMFGKFSHNFLDIFTINKLTKITRSFTKERYIQNNKQLSKLIGLDLSKYGYY